MNAQTSAFRIPILDAARIERKLLRMAWQIWEHNSQYKSITLVGIADNGIHIAQKLAEHLKAVSTLNVTTLSLELDKKNPRESEVKLSGPINDKSIVLVDDVANSGRTLLYALKPLMEVQPEKILISVLVDRKHKSFPVAPDIIGQKVATTLQEHIMVTIEGNTMAAYLE
jgi:pyrimidine operon attenuation protein/uracil phosphoribosyltransferase